jgi:transposase
MTDPRRKLVTRRKDEVITVECWTTIRFLHAQGKGIRAIAKELDLSRNTVRDALRSDAPPARTRAKRPNPQIVPFADQIATMLFEKKFIGSRILREIRQRGYGGGATALYDFLADLKEERTRTKVTERFETLPGEQGQFDWSPYSIEIGGQVRRVVFFGMVLGYSRRKFYLPSYDETQGSIYEAIESSFAHFDGAPRQLLVDNAKAFILDARPDAVVWNPLFLELCGHYRVEPRHCQVRRAQTKGKVERPFFFLEQQFIKGSAFRDFDHLCTELARFQAEELDSAIHATTQESPLARFEEERAALTHLPARRFVSTAEEFRKVSWDCLVSFQGSRYSVPHLYAGKQVWVRASQGVRLGVYDQRGECIAQHALSAKKGVTILNPEHYAGLRKQTPLTKVVLAEQFLARFPDQQPFLEGLLAQYKLAPVGHLRAILELAAVYSEEAMRAAFASAVTFNTYSHRFIRGLLERGPVAQADPQHLGVVFAAVPATPVRRDLTVYQGILEGVGR